MKNVKYLPIFIIFIHTSLCFGETSDMLQEQNPIQGEYYFTDDKNLGIHLKGKAARQLYKHLKAKADVNDCSGGRIKNVDSIECIESDDKKYECWFAIDHKGKIKEGGQSC